ncbi:MAG: hypothetical protein QW757_04510 [Candidatus Woesearchaeota archaeon]
MNLFYIGIDECYGAPGKYKYEVHVALASNNPIDYQRQRFGFYKKLGRSNHSIEDVMAELENRFMAFAILKREKQNNEEIKNRIYPVLILNLLDQISNFGYNKIKPVNVLIDGQKDPTLLNILSIPHLNIEFIPQGDTRFKLLNLADLVAYTISLHSRGLYTGAFERYKLSYQN